MQETVSNYLRIKITAALPTWRNECCKGTTRLWLKGDSPSWMSAALLVSSGAADFKGGGQNLFNDML